VESFAAKSSTGQKHQQDLPAHVHRCPLRDPQTRWNEQGKQAWQQGEHGLLMNGWMGRGQAIRQPTSNRNDGLPLLPVVRVQDDTVPGNRKKKNHYSH
jgi:hypothetical protein